MFESKLVLSSFTSEVFFEIKESQAFVSLFLSHIFDVLRGMRECDPRAVEIYCKIWVLTSVKA